MSQMIAVAARPMTRYDRTKGVMVVLPVQSRPQGVDRRSKRTPIAMPVAD